MGIIGSTKDIELLKERQYSLTNCLYFSLLINMKAKSVNTGPMHLYFVLVMAHSGHLSKKLGQND